MVYPAGALLPLCFAAFLAFGAVLVLVGANQADLAGNLELDLAHSGLLASTLAGGLGLGIVAGGPLFDRHPRRPLFAGSLLLAGVALVTVERGMHFERWLLHLAATGVAIGLYDTLISAAVATRYREGAARPMAFIHSAATLGAMLCPIFVGFLAARGDWIASFHWVGGLHVVLAGWAAAVPFPAPERQAGAGRPPAERVLSLALLPFALIAFAYVGVESAVTLFAVPYATGALGLDAARGRLAISAFWLGLLLGRLSLLGLRGRLDARVLGVAGSLGAVALAAGVALALSGIEVLLLVAGIALGCVYPLMITLASQRFPEARGTAAGLAGGAGALGGFAVPWLTGVLGDGSGVAIAFGSLAIWSALIAAVAALATRR
jgi:FHS family glucose/mannose:H+ symporter-like MFS transporter